MSDIKWVEETVCGGETLLISAYCVMHSAAGHYIGRYCKTIKGECEGLVEPWDRDSKYYPTHEAAEAALKEGYIQSPNTSTLAAQDYLYNTLN